MSFLNYATRHQPWAIREKSLFAKMRRYVSCTHTMAACNTRCCEKVSSQNASAWATTACTTEASNAISNFTVRARARSEVRLFGFSALLKFEIAGPGAQDWWDQSGRKRPPAQAPVRTSSTPHSLRTQAPGSQVTRRLSEHTLTRSLCDELAFVTRSLYGAVSVPRSVELL